MTAVLQLDAVHKAYGKPAVTVLRGVNLTVSAGETVAIVGPSGAGKSTLLHIAGLLDQPSQGHVLVQGQPTERKRDKALAKIRNATFGFVYQHHHLLREFTALENVLLPVQVVRRPTTGDHAFAKMLLETLKLSDRLHHLPHQLSGGEKQRVAIARALVNRPALLFADEPTGNLDMETAKDVQKLFTQAVKEHDMSLLLVTHNLEFAKTCDRVLTMKNGQLL